MNGMPVLRLAYAPPFDWAAMLRFFAFRAVAGVEQVEGDVYRRTIRHGGEWGIVEITDDPAGNCLRAGVDLPCGTVPEDVVAPLRSMFDLDADLDTIGAHLARDPALAPLIARNPHLRVPGCFDGFEAALRAVIGQQISVTAARRLNGRLVERCGGEMASSFDGLSRLFPTPEQVVAADLSNMGMPGARVATLKAVAEAVLADPYLLRKGANVDETVDRLRAIRGIGPWTAHYMAIRACREMDAFPASDVGLLRSAADEAGIRPSPAALSARAEAWRPWRAYAAHHLWAADAAYASAPAGRGGLLG